MVVHHAVLVPQEEDASEHEEVQLEQTGKQKLQPCPQHDQHEHVEQLKQVKQLEQRGGTKVGGSGGEKMHPSMERVEHSKIAHKAVSHSSKCSLDDA